MLDLETDAPSPRPRRTSRLARLSRLTKHSAFFEDEPSQVVPHVTNRPLGQVVRPCVLQIVQLATRGTTPDVAHTQVRKLLSTTLARLQALSLPRADVADIHYALVAFADELMLRPSSPLRDFWQAHLLQLELFGENRAGEGFFERLRRAKADQRNGVLRVYQTCLLFGFHGIYAQHGELERENLMEEVRHALGEHGSTALTRGTLSPNGQTPDEPVLDRVRNHLMLWLAVLAALSAVAWYVGIAFTLDAQSTNLRDAIRVATEDLRSGTVAGSE
ncbi:MAG TPA: DotU family type IV/VI secretion system protein [Polyangiales bacterium]|nr:DotU family type IV/VI secretion system protein [Polyangiales bacterium]